MAAPRQRTEEVNVVWVSHDDEGLQGYTTYAGRVFRLFYHEATQLFSIYPCDQDGAPVSLYLCGSCVGSIDVVLSQIVADLNHENVEEFLSWSFNVFAQIGVISVTLGDLVNVLYNQFTKIFNDDEKAAVVTASIINEMANQQGLAEG